MKQVMIFFLVRKRLRLDKSKTNQELIKINSKILATKNGSLRIKFKKIKIKIRKKIKI
jgi:hypothetical protein